MTPGEVLFGDGPIRLNPGRRTAQIDARNASERAILLREGHRA
jgi:urease beta subunit